MQLSQRWALILPLPLILIVLALSAAAADLEKNSTAVQKVPDGVRIASAEKLIHDVFKDEYGKTGAENQDALAGKLFKQGAGANDDPAAQFVLLRDACKLAGEAGDAPLAVRAADELARIFGVPAAKEKVSAVTLAIKRASAEPKLIAALSIGVTVAQQCQRDREFSELMKLLPAMQEGAANSKNVAIRPAFANWANTMRQASNEYERLKPFAEHTTAGDARQSFMSGRFLCLFQDDWENGTALLAQGGDAALKNAVVKERASKPNPADAGNAWWEAAQNEKNLFAKSRWLIRARHWYEMSITQTAGLQKALIEKRLEESLGAAPGATGWGGHAYAYSAAVMNWADANLLCELLGGHLATIGSSGESEFVNGLLKGRWAWLGGTNDNPSGQWTWVDGSIWDYTNWHSGEPNNDGGHEHWLVLIDSQWFDIGAGPRENKTGFVCEWE
jgi:hypothetical protein